MTSNDHYIFIVCLHQLYHYYYYDKISIIIITLFITPVIYLYLDRFSKSAPVQYLFPHLLKNIKVRLFYNLTFFVAQIVVLTEYFKLSFCKSAKFINFEFTSTFLGPASCTFNDEIDFNKFILLFFANLVRAIGYAFQSGCLAIDSRQCLCFGSGQQH